MPDTTSRWQRLPKVVCRYGAVRGADDSVGSAASVPASIKLFPGIRIPHSAKQSKEPAVRPTATCNGGSVGGLFVAVVARASNWHFVLLILVMVLPSCH